MTGISCSSFEPAKRLMAERVNEYNEQRTLPRNTSGQLMLSGNAFCGYCGGRLTLTTKGTVRKNADGTNAAAGESAMSAIAKPVTASTAMGRRAIRCTSWTAW